MASASPREGGADDLKRIRGVGPKLEELLHSLGFYHFDQIAAWGPSEVAWVDSNLEGFNGRATRDEWVEQARLLAAGGETEFSLVRFAGDAERAASVYADTKPLNADDVTEAVFWATSLPAHVNINVIELMPVAQSTGPFAVHKQR